MYGKIRKQVIGHALDCAFRYQGQYEDDETGLYYNRFRYYAAEEGVYLS
ncbi:RHS repeat-associated core domain-containing protein [Patiriisocius marinistellae]